MEPETKEKVEPASVVDGKPKAKRSAIIFAVTVVCATTAAIFVAEPWNDAVWIARRDEEKPWVDAAFYISFFGMLGSLVVQSIRPFLSDSFRHFIIEGVWLVAALLIIAACVVTLVFATPGYLEYLNLTLQGG